MQETIICYASLPEDGHDSKMNSICLGESLPLVVSKRIHLNVLLASGPMDRHRSVIREWTPSDSSKSVRSAPMLTELLLFIFHFRFPYTYVEFVKIVSEILRRYVLYLYFLPFPPYKNLINL